MDTTHTTRISKFLSLVLRHEPQKIGLALDSSGWVPVDELLAALNRHSFPVTREELAHVVTTNDKKRFAFSDDGQRIRANQGHSIEVDLGYQPLPPPDLLYHGTVDKFLDSIKKNGLLKGERHHVHLSIDHATAHKVGQRRGRPIILTIHSAQMHCDGLLFYRSDNSVWLTDHVPAKYIQFPDDA